MKKYILAILLLCALLLLVACGPTEETDPVSTSDPVLVVTTEADGIVSDPANVSELINEDEMDELAGPVLEEPTAEPEPTVEPTAVPVRVWDRTKFGYGAQSHATIGDPDYTMNVLSNQLGLNWVKVQLRWADVERNKGEYDWHIWDVVMKEADEYDLNVMLSIVTAPEWSRAVNDQHGPPDDFAEYNNFLTQVVTRYAGRVQAIEIWNEQNLDREWTTATGVAPERYVDFLKGAYTTLKEVNETIIVISGALAPTGAHDPERIKYMNDFIWLDEAIAAGMLDYVDCVGVHHNGYNIPPDVAYDEIDLAGSADNQFFRGPWDNPHPSWSFKSTTEGVIEKIQAVNPELKICVTEFGWGSSEGYDEYPDNFGFFIDNSLEEQAEYITKAFQIMHDSDDVMLAFLFNFDFGNKGNGPKDDNVPYSIIDLQGIPRPSFGALAEMDKPE